MLKAEVIAYAEISRWKYSVSGSVCEEQIRDGMWSVLHSAWHMVISEWWVIKTTAANSQAIIRVEY